MPSEKPKLILVVDDKLFQEIDDFRFEHRINSRSEAVRRLVIEGLKTIKAKPPKKAKE